jgi:carbon-monoxide dehydrogenase medium subunit
MKVPRHFAYELAYVRLEANELHIGALTRHAELLHSALIVEHYPMLADAERVIVDPILRDRGTVGGSLCRADPSDDLSAAFAAVNAAAVILGPSGSRTVQVRDFHTGPYETVLGPGEMLAEVVVPVKPGGGSVYEKGGHRAAPAAGAAVWLAGDTVADVGIGLTAAGADRFHAGDAEDFLRGTTATEENFAEAGRLAGARCDRRDLVVELVPRVLRRAAARARGLAA